MRDALQLLHAERRKIRFRERRALPERRKIRFRERRALPEVELEVLETLELPDALAERHKIRKRRALIEIKLEVLEALQLSHALNERRDVRELSAPGGSVRESGQTLQGSL